MAVTDGGEKPARGGGGGIGGLIVALVAVSVLGGAAGAGFGYYKAQQAVALAAEVPVNEPTRTEIQALAWSENTAVARLEPVVTNLARPAGAMVRMSTAIVFDVGAVSDVDRLRASAAQDVLAFMRTVSIGELRGASALNHLRDDLNANLRATTDGVVSELLIEQLVVQ